ncbi:MAG: nucleotidyltransferase domain-containing protein, partial [Plesiomonas sp.]
MPHLLNDELQAAGMQLPAMKRLLEQQRQHMADAFAAGQPVAELVAERSSFIDVLLCSLWQQFALADNPDLTLVAVGGYGRGELHPLSDIDLLILSAQPVDDVLAAQIGQFITLLWDLRLTVGHSVRTLQECLDEGLQDLTVATNLLESRWLCGNSTLCERLQQRVFADDFWPSPAFFRAKQQEQRERHAR